MPPLQREVWDVNFGEAGERPGIVVSRDELNRGRFVLVVPCTSSRVDERRRYANNVFLDPGVGGLTEPTIAQTHLVQPVETELLLRNRGSLDEEQLGKVLRALAWTIDLYPE